MTLNRITTQQIRIVGLAVLLCLSTAAVVFTQTKSSGEGKGHTSKPGEVQQGLKPTPPVAGHVAMDHNKPVEQKMINGKVELMEEHLKAGKAPAGTNLQHAVEMAKAGQHPQTQGPQKRGAAPAAPTTSHLHMVIQVSDDGKSTEVLHVTEVPGEYVGHDQPIGHYITEISHGNQVIAAQAMIDPFETRSFPGDTPQTRGHHMGRQKTANIVVQAPKTSLTTATTLGVKLYKLKPGGPPIEKITPETVAQLKTANRLEVHTELHPEKLAPLIKEKGKHLEIKHQ
jgi:hypothetical protein